MINEGLTEGGSGVEIAGHGLLPVSRRAANLGVLLAHLPLASAGDLAGLDGGRVEGIYAKLWELNRGGYVDRCVVGWSRPRVARWWLTPAGVDGMGISGVTWQEEWGRCNLLDRLPMVEWFYKAAATVKGYGRMAAFQWLNGMSFDAAVRYERGWVALYWSGLWQGEVVIRKRLERLGYDIYRTGLLDASVWPGMLCFVVVDQWQRELVYRAAKKAGLLEHVGVMVVADESRDGVWDGGPSRGFVYQAFDGREVGAWPFADRVVSSLWGTAGGCLAGRMFDCVAEWPGMGLKTGKAYLAEGKGSRRSGKALKDLVDHGLVGVEDGYGRPRYWVSPKGIDVLRRRDRMGYVFTNDKAQAWSWLRRPKLKSHEDGVMDLMGGFMSAGLPVAAGWRSWEPLGGGGGIAPDGMVYLHHSPYGEGWHYVEYERTARGEGRVKRKLRGYGSAKRQDRWPLLVVARDGVAERAFNEVGRENGLLMLTTDLDRLREYGGVGNLGCWKMYGEGVAVG